MCVMRVYRDSVANFIGYQQFRILLFRVERFDGIGWTDRFFLWGRGKTLTGVRGFDFGSAWSKTTYEVGSMKVTKRPVCTYVSSHVCRSHRTAAAAGLNSASVTYYTCMSGQRGRPDGWARRGIYPPPHHLEYLNNMSKIFFVTFFSVLFGVWFHPLIVQRRRDL